MLGIQDVLKKTIEITIMNQIKSNICDICDK